MMLSAKTPAAFKGAQKVYEDSLETLRYWQEEDEEYQEATWLKKTLLALQKKKKVKDEFIALSIG